MADGAAAETAVLITKVGSKQEAIATAKEWSVNAMANKYSGVDLTKQYGPYRGVPESPQSAAEIAKAIEAQRRLTTPKPTLYSSPKHNPNSVSPEPPNAAGIFANAVPDNAGVWWAKGSDGTIHRFAGTNGQVHWNGSTATAVKPIREENIPPEIRDFFK